MNFRRLCLLLAVASLSACELGEGSRPVSLTIIPAGVVNAAGQLQMTECFREPLALQVTFSDGQIGNVTSRATWSVRDPSNPANPNPAVQVSNGDVKAQAIINGEFKVLESTNFGRGVLIPKAPTTTPVIVTANFLGLKADLPVVVDSLESALTFTGSPGQAKAELVPRPVVGGTPPSPKFIGEGFSERFTIRLTKNGRLLDAGDFSRTDSIFNSFLNPVLWTFSGGVFSDGDTTDTDTTNDADLFLVGGATRSTAFATLTPNGGLVTGVNAGSAPLVAELSSVDGAIAPCGTVTTDTQIAEVDGLLVLSHEKDFNSLNTTPSSATVSDLVVGTSELLKVTANLVGTNEKQDVTAQVGYEVIEEDRDVCVEFLDATTTMTETRCTSSILTLGLGGFMTTTAGTDGSFNVLTVDNKRLPGNNTTDPRFNGDTAVDEVKVRACFPACTFDSNDSSPTLVSDPITIRAVPARLDPASLVVIQPDAPAPQLAFTVPGIQFKAYGTYTAGSIVNGAFVAATAPEQRFSNNNPTATQNIGRYLSWFARPAGDDSAISDVAQLTNGSSNGSVEATGQVFYICNPESVDELIDIYAITNNTAVVSTDISDDIAPVTLTVEHNPAVTDRACE